MNAPLLVLECAFRFGHHQVVATMATLRLSDSEVPRLRGIDRVIEPQIEGLSKELFVNKKLRKSRKDWESVDCADFRSREKLWCIAKERF